MATWRYISEEEFVAIKSVVISADVSGPSPYERVGIYECVQGSVLNGKGPIPKDRRMMEIPKGHMVLVLEKVEDKPWCYSSLGVSVLLQGTEVEVKDGTPVAIVPPDSVEALHVE